MREVFISIASVVILLMGIYAAIWGLWCWVLPKIWPTGPENIINPSFWLFVGGLFLIRFILGSFQK